MKTPRIKHLDQMATYHCTSYLNGYAPRLDHLEKEHLLRVVQEYARFCGVRVLACSLREDLFQVIVEVAPRPLILPTAEELLQRLDTLTCVRNKTLAVARRLASFRRSGDALGEQRYLETFFRQMWDVSAYIKAVKQQFSAWRNRRFGRTGPQWAGCFRSTVLEPDLARRVASACGDGPTKWTHEIQIPPRPPGADRLDAWTMDGPRWRPSLPPMTLARS